jgi:hypothetical protein
MSNSANPKSDRMDSDRMESERMSNSSNPESDRTESDRMEYDKMYIFLISDYFRCPAGQVGSSAENTRTAQADAAHWELGYS